MRFKTLKHKTLPDVFGRVDDYGEGYEIAHIAIPYLQPETATMELAIEYWKKHGPTDPVVKQLEDYEMVIVELNII